MKVDFGKFMRFCQLEKMFSLILISVVLVLSSCSKQVVKTSYTGYVAKPTWFNISEKFTLLDDKDKTLVHPFYDIEPDFDKEKRWINFFITVPQNSFFNYELDLLSGELYKERNFCESSDVWGNYKKEIFRPNFTLGIVPKMLNELSLPQKIAIFSDPVKMINFKYHPVNYSKAKIVGSLLYEYCEYYPCDTKEKWTKSQILIAVNPIDSDLTNIVHLSELREKIDWAYFKAFLSSMYGVHQLGNNFFPAFRITKELSLSDTIDYFVKNSKVVDLKILQTEREKCFKLYDDFYESIEKIRKNKKTQLDLFYKTFKNFYIKSGDQFYTCQKNYRTSNVNLDPDRFWFFSYIQAFFNMDKNGFYYSCGDKSWFYNPKSENNKYLNDMVNEMEKCKPRDFEKSFDLAINAISLMKNQINKAFRFVEYDSSHGGSHQKIYSWIPDFGKSNYCKNQNSEIRKDTSFDIFPQDVVWQHFDQEDSSLIQ